MIQTIVEDYRNQQWYGFAEDPEFIIENTIEIISQVIGPEDDTFFYNGKRITMINDESKRYYLIWKEAINGKSIAEAAFAGYLVYEDGTVEENQETYN